MLAELFLFLLASCVIVIPGIALAVSLGIGRTRIDRFAYGCTLGFALAAYLASLISQWELRWFYPIWIAIGIISLAAALWRRLPAEKIPLEKFVIALLIVVAATRFAVALLHVLPPGWDPSFHLILAMKIQSTGRAIHDWLPFENAALNYPTGSHVLVVILSRISGLPLHTTFMFFIQLLGIATTAQIYTFTKNATDGPRIALFSAACYAMLPWWGSLSYFDWGGLPNELGMLFLMAALSLWIDSKAQWRGGAIAFMLAAVPLVHHHVMLVAAALVLTTYAITFIKRQRVPISVLLSPILAAVLSSFFIVPYALKARTLASTSVLQGGETPIALQTLPQEMGYAMLALAVIGLFVCLRRKPKLHQIVPACIVILGLLYLVTEYAWPAWLRAHGKIPSTALTPSRFLSDMNYFLPVLAGVALVAIADLRKVPTGLMLLLTCLLSATEFQHWQRLASPPDPMLMGFMRAASWIEQHTSPDTIVLNSEQWTIYLTQRRAAVTPMPVSEPNVDAEPRALHARALIEGKASPGADDHPMVMIVLPNSPWPKDFPVLWTDPQTQVKVVKLWPR